MRDNFVAPSGKLMNALRRSLALRVFCVVCLTGFLGLSGGMLLAICRTGEVHAQAEQWKIVPESLSSPRDINQSFTIALRVFRTDGESEPDVQVVAEVVHDDDPTIKVVLPLEESPQDPFYYSAVLDRLPREGRYQIYPIVRIEAGEIRFPQIRWSMEAYHVPQLKSVQFQPFLATGRQVKVVVSGDYFDRFERHAPAYVLLLAADGTPAGMTQIHQEEDGSFIGMMQAPNALGTYSIRVHYPESRTRDGVSIRSEYDLGLVECRSVGVRWGSVSRRALPLLLTIVIVVLLTGFSAVIYWLARSEQGRKISNKVEGYRLFGRIFSLFQRYAGFIERRRFLRAVLVPKFRKDVLVALEPIREAIASLQPADAIRNQLPDAWTSLQNHTADYIRLLLDFYAPGTPRERMSARNEAYRAIVEEVMQQDARSDDSRLVSAAGQLFGEIARYNPGEAVLRAERYCKKQIGPEFFRHAADALIRTTGFKTLSLVLRGYSDLLNAESAGTDRRQLAGTLQRLSTNLADMEGKSANTECLRWYYGLFAGWLSQERFPTNDQGDGQLNDASIRDLVADQEQSKRVEQLFEHPVVKWLEQVPFVSIRRGSGLTKPFSSLFPSSAGRHLRLMVDFLDRWAEEIAQSKPPKIVELTPVPLAPAAASGDRAIGLLVENAFEQDGEGGPAIVDIIFRVEEKQFEHDPVAEIPLGRGHLTIDYSCCLSDGKGGVDSYLMPQRGSTTDVGFPRYLPSGSTECIEIIMSLDDDGECDETITLYSPHLSGYETERGKRPLRKSRNPLRIPRPSGEFDLKVAARYQDGFLDIGPKSTEVVIRLTRK